MINIPKFMQAAILEKLNQPLLVDQVQLPGSLHFGQVLVKLLYSGICGSQIGEIEGVKGKDIYLPHLLGHEGTGKVIAVGGGVKSIKVKDLVVLHWMKNTGIESNPPDYKWQGKPLNAGRVTTFNEYAVVSENRLTVIPVWVNLKTTTLFGCALTTAFGVLTNKAKLSLGESIVVFGVGGVGLNIIQGASLMSAYPIIGIDIYDHKLKLAKKLGATHTINSQKYDVARKIYKLLEERGADVTIDTTGLPEVIQLAYETTHSQGKTILVGVPKKGSLISIYTLPLHFGKIITGTHGGETEPERDIPRYLKLLKQGLLNLDQIITEEFSLAQINTAISKIKAGEISGRAVIKYEK